MLSQSERHKRLKVGSLQQNGWLCEKILSMNFRKEFFGNCEEQLNYLSSNVLSIQY